MPINNCPFTALPGGIPRPYLPITIINPHTSLHVNTIGLIDTGADECAIPANLAPALGHILQAGQITSIGTASGSANAYKHTTAIKIFHPSTGTHLYNINNAPIDFMEDLSIVLLGVRSFLSAFILKIDYPLQTFSTTSP